MISWNYDKSGCNDIGAIMMLLLLGYHNGHRVGLIAIIIVLEQTY